MGVEEVDIILFLRPGQPPEIPCVTVRRSLLRSANHAEMVMQRGGGRNANLVKQEIIDHLVERESFAAAIALAFAGGEFFPFSWEAVAIDRKSTRLNSS